MRRLLSSDLENFDWPLGVLLQRLQPRRDAIRKKLREIEARLLNGELDGTSVHSPWAGNRCAPLVDDYVVVFAIDEWTDDAGEMVRHVHLLALQFEPTRH
jgi:hypothetical protein